MEREESAGAFRSEADRWIADVGSRARSVEPRGLQLVLEHVARRGFDPLAREPVRAGMVGQIWGGSPLRRGQWLSTGAAHYVRHVLAGREWPPGTGYQRYLDDIRRIVLAPDSGLLVSRFGDAGWQLTAVGNIAIVSEQIGSPWVMVEYRVATGYWITAFRLRHGLTPALYLEGDPRRTNRTWLRPLRW